MGRDEGAAVVEAEPARRVDRGDAWTDFAANWLALQDGLFRMALLVAGNRSDAEDAVADAMAATFAPWRAGRVASLEAYARTTVMNRLIGRGRRRATADRHRRRRSGDDRGERAADDQVVESDLLRRALRDLPPRQRAVVVLRYYVDLSVAETAEAIGCAPGTVKSQTHDALAVLRARLGRPEEGPW
jgi:RNA polymerase sigma factor (sigma-70 family)